VETQLACLKVESCSKQTSARTNERRENRQTNKRSPDPGRETLPPRHHHGRKQTSERTNEAELAGWGTDCVNLLRRGRSVEQIWKVQKVEKTNNEQNHCLRKCFHCFWMVQKA
jgi:hypothetical protein